MKPILLLFTIAAIGAAQESADVRVHVAGAMPRQVEFVAMEFGGATTVKNAPYSAEAITENTQVLVDGNRIQHKSTATMYRDSQGRTRREQSLGGIGPWAPAKEPMQTIFINDAVAGVHYMLDPRTKTARKMPALMNKIKAAGAVEAGDTQVFEQFIAAPPPGAASGSVHVQVGRHVVTETTAPSPQSKTEPLGKRMFEGVEAEGKRVTTTIPAGQIGNERPIEIVSETWYSPQLQAMVYSKRGDPRFGETVYRLTNINRGEPLSSLFQVPPDYTVEEGPKPMRFERKIAEPRP